MLFHLLYTRFSVSYLIKKKSYWLNDSDASVHRQFHKIFLKLLYNIEQSPPQIKGPAITLQNISERLLHTAFDFTELFLINSIPEKFEKEQPNKIWDMVSASWWQRLQLRLETYPVLHRGSLAYRTEFNTSYWQARRKGS